MSGRPWFPGILLVNGHGDNQPTASVAQEWACRKSGVRVKFHNWWSAPETWKIMTSIDSVASHVSWMESFPWIRPAHIPQPEGMAEIQDVEGLRRLTQKELRDCAGIGSFGGVFRKPDEIMEKVWQTGIEEVRPAIAEDWQ